MRQLALCLLLAGCSGNQGLTQQQKALNKMKWEYAEDAVELNFTADSHLNQYDGQAHNLLVVIAQFDQVKVFARYLANSQQLSNLLMMSSPPPEIIGLKRIFLQPGQVKHLSIPRLEGSRMIAVVAGYGHLDPTRSARLYQIGVDLSSSGFFSKVWTAKPQPICIDLLMGADALLRAKESRLLPPVPLKPQSGEINLPLMQL